MDRITHLSDELILKILTFLETKDVMRTMLLSKRWKPLWMLVQRLDFDETTHFPEPVFWGAPDPDYGRFHRFVDRSLMSREGQSLQTLSLKLNRHSTQGDIEIWVRTALKRGLMELILLLEYSSSRLYLPKRLYSCETLVVLKLERGTLCVPYDHVCLRSLKTLSLKSMSYSDGDALIRFLQGCHVLEELFIQHCRYRDQDSLSFKIVVPSLKRLSLLDDLSRDSGMTGIVIDAPLLKRLLILDRSGSLSFSSEESISINISEVVKATIDVVLRRPEKILHSLSLVEHVRLCLSASEVVYPDGICFKRLKYLEVCTCKSDWLLLFMRIFEDSPNLKFVKTNQCHPVIEPRPHWDKPGSVPRCLLSSLEMLEWINYEGTEEEKELSTYILRTAVCLKKASFNAKSYDPKKKLQMLQDLSLSRRISSTCELVFH